jgi:hypothetical protein
LCQHQKASIVQPASQLLTRRYFVTKRHSKHARPAFGSFKSWWLKREILPLCPIMKDPVDRIFFRAYMLALGESRVCPSGITRSRWAQRRLGYRVRVCIYVSFAPLDHADMAWSGWWGLYESKIQKC